MKFVLVEAGAVKRFGFRDDDASLRLRSNHNKELPE
jgi:hypothetical protein